MTLICLCCCFIFLVVASEIYDSAKPFHKYPGDLGRFTVISSSLGKVGKADPELHSSARISSCHMWLASRQAPPQS